MAVSRPLRAFHFCHRVDNPAYGSAVRNSPVPPDSPGAPAVFQTTGLLIGQQVCPQERTPRRKHRHRLNLVADLGFPYASTILGNRLPAHGCPGVQESASPMT